MCSYLLLGVIWYLIIVAVWFPIVKDWHTDNIDAEVDTPFLVVGWPFTILFALTVYPFYRVVRWLSHRLAADE